METIELDLPVVPPIQMRLHEADELISRVLRRHRLWEAASSWFCLRHVRPGDHAVDVGANIGYYSLLLSRLAGESGQVDAFEPEPSNLTLLRANLRMNGCANVRVHPVALADIPGRRELYLCRSNRGDHRLGHAPERDRIAVPVTTADLLLGTQSAKIDLVKIDAQGAEELVLVGMRRLIEQHRHSLTLLLELCPLALPSVGSSCASMLTLLDALGGRYLLFNRWSPDAVQLRGLDRTEVRRLGEAMIHAGADASLNLVVVFSADAACQLHARLATPASR
ncbi:MAG: FkbM family methyltransferase [Geminicoccaceae bacterium]